jgi:hypothetical protein
MKSHKFIIAALIIVQLVDIALHAATDQLEIIRVTSNLIILLWLAVLVWGRLNTNFSFVSIGAIAIYGVLNIIFLAREGITNAGQLRTTLFLLVLLTVILSTSLIYLWNKRNS